MVFFYLLVSVMPLSNHRLWGRFVGEMTVVKYLGGACLLYALFYLGFRRKMPPFLATWQARLFLMFYLIAAVSYFAKSQPGDWRLSPFMTYTSLLVLFFITLTVVDSLKRVRWVMLSAVGSVALGSLYVLREWQRYHTAYRGLRPGWVVGDPNYFTVSALVVLPLALYLILERRPPWERFFCLGCLMVTFLAVMVAASRGGFLGLVAAFLVVLWHSKQRLRNLVVAAALLVPISLVAPSSPIRRFLDPVHGDREAEQRRLVVWDAGLRMVAEHPLVGVGLGNFKPMVVDYEDRTVHSEVQTVAHNAYIEVAAELGFPALLLFMGILYLSYRSLGQARRLAAEHGPLLLQQAALGLQAGVVGCGVAIIFVSGQYQKLFWLAIFLSMCIPRLRLATPPQQRESEKQTGMAEVSTAGPVAGHIN